MVLSPQKLQRLQELCDANDIDALTKAVDDDGDDITFRLYPLGENEFGRKGGMLKLKFGDGCVSYGEFTCKKL